MAAVVYQSMEDLIRRVRSEYLEMPGLKLTPAQASRLWGLDPSTAQRLLGTLMDSQFLTRTRDGHYRRAEL
jgi:DNA-binding IclR family transcriptional regulator